MKCDFRTGGQVSEMAIVDTFTKLIFGEEDEFNSDEKRIIQAIRQVDDSVAPDSLKEMGRHLRALGVTEMIQLVARVQTCLTAGLQALIRVREESILDRRAH